MFFFQDIWPCYLSNVFCMHWSIVDCTVPVKRGGGGGGGGCSPPRNFQIAIFGQKNNVIFGQNHLIFGQAMDKIFGQLTSAPPPPFRNETGPVRLYVTVCLHNIPVSSTLVGESRRKETTNLKYNLTVCDFWSNFQRGILSEEKHIISVQLWHKRKIKLAEKW